MLYFCDINNLTELQEKRIKLLQNCPNDATLINSEFMQVKDMIIGKRNPLTSEVRKQLPRISYTVEIVSDEKVYVELRDDCIYVSPPRNHAFNAEYLNGQFELPKVNTPDTMAFFVSPLTSIPIFCFT